MPIWKWQKLGKLNVPDNNFFWMQSHVSNPVALPFGEDVVRIFFNCRDEKQSAYVGFLDMDMNKGFEITNISKTPVLQPGGIGLFDDSGVSLGCLVDVNGELFLYYVGWNLSVTVPWRNSIGLAIYDKKQEKFVKYQNAPVMDRSREDPYSLSYPFVLKDEGIYKMWYGSNRDWGDDGKAMNHVIKYAESKDGIHWKRENVTCLDTDNKTSAYSRPFVRKENGIFKMWYSFKGRAYRIGYAESNNGIDWKRKDVEAGITVSDSGWDSEMVCYPYIFNFRDAVYLLYNGNDYGKQGLGIAKAILS